MINLYLWRGRPNFGDLMSIDIVEWAFQDAVRVVDSTTSNKLIAIGSVLDKAAAGDTIWGTGVHPRRFYGSNENFFEKTHNFFSKKKFDDVDFLAVRGPVTQDFVFKKTGKWVEVFGDPAVIAPLVYPRVVNPVRKFLLINHFSVPAETGSIHCLDPSLPWREIVDQICQSEFVISSSLHGLILAEAYGVPALFLHNSREGLIKYIDYFGSTGRFPVVFNNLASITELDDSRLRKNVPPDLSSLAASLITSAKGYSLNASATRS